MRKQIIFENQVGLLIHNGRVVRSVGPGVYRTFELGNMSYIVYPLSAQPYAMSSSFSTSDNASIFVDLPVDILIRDAHRHYMSGISIYEAVSRVFNRFMQEYVGKRSLAEILEEQIAISNEDINIGLSELGLEAIIQGLARIRLPRNLQNAIDAQEVARQRAKAELEEARGRTAVLRHYANAAKMTKDNPELLRLLLGQKARSISVAFDASK